MKMWSLQNLLLVLWIALICVSSAAAVIHVFGYEGRDVNVSCPYEQGYESYEKYLCKNDCSNDDDVLIRTSETNKNKYSIYDDTRSQIFTATISDLRSVDAGTYCCGVTRTGFDILTTVQLEISQDSCCDSVTKIQSHEEGSVSISCPYESQYQNNLKYMCRGKRPSTCLQQAVITSDNTHNAQFTLTDDKESRKFTVTVSSLTLNDSGSYLCGVHRNNRLDVFSAVELEVKDVTHFTVLVYTLPVVLVLPLVLIFVLVTVFKKRANKSQGSGVNMNTSNAVEAGGQMRINHICENTEAATYSVLSLHTEPSTTHNDTTSEVQDNVYHSLPRSENIYSTCHR